MNYKENYDKAIEQGFSIYKLTIANEVNDAFDNLGSERPDFEEICERISTAYVKVDCDTTLSMLVYSLKKLLKDKELKDISTKDIINNVDYYYYSEDECFD